MCFWFVGVIVLLATPKHKLMSNSESQAFTQIESITDYFNLNNWTSAIESLGFKYLEKEAFDTLYGDRREVKEYLKYEDELSTERIDELIHQEPLEVATRSQWTEIGSAAYDEPGDFKIVLCLGGPAVRIFGSCEGGYPSDIELQHQDWFTPWETVRSLSEIQREALEWFCNFFVY